MTGGYWEWRSVIHEGREGREGAQKGAAATRVGYSRATYLGAAYSRATYSGAAYSGAGYSGAT